MNPIATVEKDVVTVAKDVAAGVAHVATFADKTDKVLAILIKDKPALKTALGTMIEQASALSALIVKDTGEDGLNLADDAATLAQIKTFFSFIATTVEPEIVAVWGEIKPVKTFA